MENTANQNRVQSYKDRSKKIPKLCLDSVTCTMKNILMVKAREVYN